MDSCSGLRVDRPGPVTGSLWAVGCIQLLWEAADGRKGHRSKIRHETARNPQKSTGLAESLGLVAGTTGNRGRAETEVRVYQGDGMMGPHRALATGAVGLWGFLASAVATRCGSWQSRDQPRPAASQRGRRLCVSVRLRVSEC
ncbi:hypothetical protein NDU88_003811 [Pleurodeles waltl]|uniref:Uncharacterized protein n=1 Tax=Pleurodeles waltl TaxID=8319 RepID=A0AAV7WTV6_PLEWA|nr:hypothetical protein NDU88_003811 [Pleurodeles waltl]